MIKRIWHGYADPHNADVYERLLLSEILPEIGARNIPGYRGVEVLRRNLDSEVEFITIMRFDSIESVKGFVGEDYEVAHVPDSAQAVLKRWDERSQHYRVLSFEF